MISKITLQFSFYNYFIDKNMAYQYKLNLDSSIQEMDTVKIMFSLAAKYKPSNIIINDVFVAGCGDGTEASAIRNSLKFNVVGVDNGLLEEYKDDTLKILNRNLMELDFEDNSFDLIYSYHVLEHVDDPNVVLKKLSSMLREGGVLLIGFPNKKRILGYLGSKNASKWEKIKWNLIDYKDRILLKFENKYGAHAGFTKNEFDQMCKLNFANVTCLNREYYLLKYFNREKVINRIFELGLSEYLLPANYFICFKK